MCIRDRYALDPLILSIEEVTLASTGQSLTKTTVRDLRVWAAGSSSLDINAWKTKTGSPQYYSEDVEPGKITLIPVPVATTDTLLLTVYRLPLEPLDWENRDSDLSLIHICLAELEVGKQNLEVYKAHVSALSLIHI